MWLPSLISQKIVDMQKSGFRLTAEDIYSVNQASLKDAIVHFNRGCTGELISDKGLLITNHHCGLGQIQAHSSVENDYIKDGFWAMTMEDELPNPGTIVRFLDRMEDVTDVVLKGYKSGMTEQQRSDIISKNSKAIIDKAIASGKGIRASVEALYYGNQYFLFVYREYNDIRLVGAPPASIGKFGGDTDNWMWPRHTGDFSLFRIYADKNNDPAPYSKDNVPYTPKKFFKISLAGVNEGDFTFVYGFPGRTQQYVTSDAVRYIAEISNPHKIMLRTLRLDIQREEMAKDKAVRIQYTSKNSGVSNSWKKWQGEMKGILKMDEINNKVQLENRFKSWAKSHKEYDGLLEKFEQLYADLKDYAFVTDYYNETISPNELTRFAGSVVGLVQRNRPTDETIDAFFKNYFLPIDYRSFVAIVDKYRENVPNDFKPAYFFEKMDQFGSVAKWGENIFTTSIFADKDLLKKSISEGKIDALLNDPAYEFFKKFSDYQNEKIAPVVRDINSKINLLYRDYMRGQMEFEKDKVFFPDANSTLRVAYGHVEGYKPMDGVYYNHVSTLDGIIQKDNPEIFDYDIPQTLRDIYAAKDYGRWEVDGSIPVCFIATNHTSGGNSGSPVINADGNLIGVNFDRVWEGTMSDIVFDPEICRNISIDIRFAIFVIDKIGNAGHLLDEMVFVE